MIFRIIKKLKNKNFKDIFLRIKRHLYQRRVKSKPNQYFYADTYLLKNIKFKEIEEVVKQFPLSCTVFPSVLGECFDEKVISQANSYLNHNFNLLGSGLVNLNFNSKYKGLEGILFNQKENTIAENTFSNNYKSINWFVDFKTAYQWNKNTFYAKVREESSIRGVDIKLPWELSRCQHFGVLASAYQMTKEDKYALEIKNQILDWITSNSYCYGPNWVCAMDVGIRVVNWLMAYEQVKESNIFDEEFNKLFLKSVLHHQEYILNNLEWTSKLTSNHYLSDIAGLFFIGSYVKVFKNSQKVLDFAYKELEKEIFKQTYKDGMNSEGSTSYHRLVLEMFAYCYSIDTDRRFSENYKNRLMKMFTFSEALCKEDGTIPQIGDNDSGVFFRFKDREIVDFSYLRYLKENILNKKISPSKWDYVNKSSKKQVSYQAFSFDDSGVYIYKSNNIYFSIYNGSNGQKGNGGHAHNDKLSFTLNYKGTDVFVDPGTYLYTPLPEMRNKFRSTYSHNTVGVNNQEQNRYIDNYLFGLYEDCTECVSSFLTNEEGFQYKGFHNGYTRIDKGLLHKRNIIFNREENKVEIEDVFEDKKYLKKASFIIDKKIIKKTDKDSVSLIFGDIKFVGGKELKIEDYVYSKAYGEVDKKGYVRIQIKFNQELKTFIKLT